MSELSAVYVAPQSDDDVRPVVEALRRLDPLLDIRWNPTSFKKPTVFSVMGIAPPEQWEGRWEIIRYDTPNLHETRTWCRIITVTERTTNAHGIETMIADGPYAPVGMYLLEYMALWDRAQQHFIKAMDDLWAEHEKKERFQHAEYRAGHQEALERVYREHGGGMYWMGGAQGHADPRTEATLYATPPDPREP